MTDANREIEVLRREFAALKAELVGIKHDLLEMRDDLKKLAAVANMGKGALWALLKLGGLLAFLIAAAAWLWQRIHGSP